MRIPPAGDAFPDSAFLNRDSSFSWCEAIAAGLSLIDASALLHHRMPHDSGSRREVPRAGDAGRQSQVDIPSPSAPTLRIASRKKRLACYIYQRYGPNVELSLPAPQLPRPGGDVSLKVGRVPSRGVGRKPRCDPWLNGEMRRPQRCARAAAERKPWPGWGAAHVVFWSNPRSLIPGGVPVRLHRAFPPSPVHPPARLLSPRHRPTAAGEARGWSDQLKSRRCSEKNATSSSASPRFGDGPRDFGTNESVSGCQASPSFLATKPDAGKGRAPSRSHTGVRHRGGRPEVPRLSN